MVPTIRLALAIILLGSSAFANLELTPREAEYELDGVKLHQLVFPDSGQQVTYTPPRGWNYSGASDRFVLHPPGSSAEATITVTHLPQPEAFDEATIKRLSNEALASIPKSATHIAIVAQEKNPLMIERKETFLIVINYDYLDGPRACSIMFLNRKNEQVRFQLTCHRSDFVKLQQAFQQSHYSWQNL
jgi:hypothetical protein